VCTRIRDRFDGDAFELEAKHSEAIWKLNCFKARKRKARRV